MSELPPSASSSSVTDEIWLRFRPYFVRFTVDFLISASLWIALVGFHALTKFLELASWARDIILTIHAAGAVAAFALFALLFAVDIITLHSRETK